MKSTRLFLFLFFVIFALLSFSSCAFDFSALMPGATTAPTTTTVSPVTTTSPITTTAPVTTTAPAITTAPQISQNPIKSVSLTTDGSNLVIKYKNNVTQNLVADVGVREGFGSAYLADYDFDTESRIASLTYQVSSFLNRAELILGNEGEASITLYLREMNGKLEFCRDLSLGEWKAFAPANRTAAVDGVPILTELLNQAEYGKQETSSMGKGVIFTLNNGDVRFRATEWMQDGYHFAVNARLHGSSNNNFNFQSEYTVPSTMPYDQVSGGTRFKSSGDDIAPPNFNGTTIGGNHGYYVIAAIPNTTGLTEEDIGSVWKMNAQSFMLVKLEAGEAWFCPFDDQMMQSGYFTYVSIPSGATLTHVSGAANTSPITASKTSVQTQFRPATNHATQRAFLDGKTEIDLTKDGTYECEFIDFQETYDIIYLPTILEYLKENVGKNTNESHYDEAIERSYVTMDTTYRFHKNGAMVLYNDLVCNEDLMMSFVMGVMSCGMSSTQQYVYVPGTTIAETPIKQESSDRITWGKKELVDPEYPPTTYFQMTSADGAMAMNIGFYPLYGDARPEVRLSLIHSESQYGRCHSTMKMYPYLFRSDRNVPMEAGKSFSFISYRIPSIKTDEDMLAVNHYWVGDEIVLSLHTQKVLDGKEITLPDYMNGMTVSVIEKSESMTVESTVIENGKIAFSTNNAGYAIVKLSPAK